MPQACSKDASAAARPLEASRRPKPLGPLAVAQGLVVQTELHVSPPLAADWEPSQSVKSTVTSNC
eukprot:CAMPEP_0177513570 /NCGR_PEP_ID=MMETSP0369-20130122/43841_1 /TAXON_ID=447022 ORGANISM="Scrippsiella hangoei-like, Strain SHHI-4" /NCGR_SAMPLE_ID=MMETSP0369 /ASSEMBLY_ACC=CAM_ASM_000364 /LENGTH=64 /DNA_ID=CAMNT_0018992177 /DNA_START=84 /DNA_END=275 /DNA_ORIENTATION=-